MNIEQSLQETVDAIAKTLIRRKQTIAVAESVTAGNIQAALSRAEKAAFFFQGGMTVYNIGQKCRQLNIDPIHAESCNSVSQKVADQLSTNIASVFLSHYGIGITGYAAPLPEKGIEDLFAYVSISREGEVIASKKLLAEPVVHSLQAQLNYSFEALKLLQKHLEEAT